MFTLPFLEVMVIRGCNLSCQGCTTFSDLPHAGYFTWDQGRKELEPWIDRINLPAIGIMGGEPLMNPYLDTWLLGIRKLLPNSQIRFTTNGILLEKNWHIFELMRDMENTVFKISAHVHDPKLTKTIEHIMSSYSWEPVKEFGIDRWKEKNKNFRFQVARPTRFFKTFLNDYANMSPHNNDPAQAFEICVQKKCPLLHNGRLYKCGTIALTPNVAERHGWPNKNLWTELLDNGLGYDCEDQELEKFINNFGKPHILCRQCPSNNDLASILDHTVTVSFK